MAKNLKKFVNKKFMKTISLELLGRIMERHQADLHGFDLGVFGEDHHEEAAREAVEAFFAGPENAYPAGLVADLHQIAELGNVSGQDIILQQAQRLGVQLDVHDEDPKQFALRVFLEHPLLFQTASDMMLLTAWTSLGEFAGLEEGVEADLDEEAKARFQTAAAAMFERDMRGDYCRVGWYEDGDDVVLVVSHGALITTTPVVEGHGERVISFRQTAHAVLSYNAMSGALKIGGVAKPRRADLAEIFAATMLARPGFFAGADAQNLYTLEGVENAGFAFALNHAFDPGIRRVQIREVQVDQVAVDPASGQQFVSHSLIVRDGRDSALARLGAMMPRMRLGQDWRLNYLVISIHFDVGAARPKKVTVKVKPPSYALFKRTRFEDRIMALLRRNGLLHDRDAARAAAAAE